MKESHQKPDMTQTKTLSSRECCMCGDFGFSNQLFHCKICQFRSQHRYCSNQYPNILDSQRICNWCLSQRDDSSKEKSQNSSNSSSSLRNDDVSQDEGKRAVKKSSPTLRRHVSAGGPIKKQRSVPVPVPEPAPPSPAPARKRIVTEAERLRRTQSENIAKVGITRRFFRNRVRRYKLLEEVSS